MPFSCVVGGERAGREDACRRLLDGVAAVTVDVARWPFERETRPDTSSSGAFLLPDLHMAFLHGQTPGTRLVLTQSTYQLQRWLDLLDEQPDVRVVAHASRAGLRRTAPEAFGRRGPWSRIQLISLDDDSEQDPGIDPALRELRDAFGALPAERLDTFTRAADRAPSNAALHLCVASAQMELDQLEAAQQAIGRALELAPDWEAAWFEYGKLWLRADDLERAADRFREAARLMPTFSAALSNLGAALAETERQEEAIRALEQALQHDPEGYPVLNNLAVIYREQGRLDEAIAAGRRVTTLAPDFVFGHYNLAHALFLSGRFVEAKDTYLEGQRRDPQRNAVQACRLAVSRAAAGDFDTAIAELERLADAAPPDAREALLGEAEATLEALLAVLPASGAGLHAVLDRIRARLA